MRFVSIAVAVTFLASAGIAQAQSKQDFRLTNKTGYTIDKVFVAPSKSNDWEEDILGRDVLENGAWVNITFPKKNQVCSYDVKVVYDDSTPAEWHNFNLCEISKISIFYSHSEDKTWAEYE
ncbi:hypothetical protein VZ95_20595 [Elstera litoralis]|uniref:Argininosuccinate lyase n=2 Tax=Elstera litoralis TaxID=552518 RepID=A0A0F3IJL9_9PROT|nr:hypothetical protein [Elstera litoralis]KJV06713.1 hypothetical protein VZ95_20595 [Elstera litoralis]